MKSRIFRAVAVLGVLATSTIIPHTIASASADPLAGIPADYKDYQEFPACSATTTTFCISSWGVDLDHSGNYVKPSSDLYVSFAAWLFSIKGYNTPGLAYEMRVGGLQELSPAIPAGTNVQFSVNTGAFKPSPSLYTQAGVVAFDVNNVDGNWITTGTLTTSSYSVADNCDPDKGCSNPKNRHDYASFLQGVQFYEDPNPLLDSKKGTWVSTNATTTYGIVFDKDTMTWTVQVAGPPTKADGTPNAIHYATFIPETFINFAFGTTSDVLATSIATTRTDGTSTTPVGSTVTQVFSPIPGLLISMPNISMTGTSVSSQGVHSSAVRFSTNPKLTIKPKVSLLKAPVIRTVKRVGASAAKVTSTPVAGATKYQAMCSLGASSRTATSRSTTITVNGLTSGKWSCVARGVKKVGGRWSRKSTVTIP